MVNFTSLYSPGKKNIYIFLFKKSDHNQILFCQKSSKASSNRNYVIFYLKKKEKKEKAITHGEADKLFVMD